MLADYEEAQLLAKERRELENERARQMIERLAFTADPTAHPDPPAKVRCVPFAAAVCTMGYREPGISQEGEASDADSELEDADLQEILRRRREQQLLRLKAASGRPTPSSAPHRPSCACEARSELCQATLRARGGA